MAWTKEQRRNHCRQIGTLGGQKTVATYGRKFMSEIGKIGFDEYCRRHHEGHRASAVAAIRKMRDPDRNVKQPVGHRRMGEIARARSFVESL